MLLKETHPHLCLASFPLVGSPLAMKVRAIYGDGNKLGFPTTWSATLPGPPGMFYEKEIKFSSV